MEISLKDPKLLEIVTMDFERLPISAAFESSRSSVRLSASLPNEKKTDLKAARQTKLGPCLSHILGHFVSDDAINDGSLCFPLYSYFKPVNGSINRHRLFPLHRRHN